jgi:hypothetical protein
VKRLEDRGAKTESSRMSPHWPNHEVQVQSFSAPLLGTRNAKKWEDFPIPLSVTQGHLRELSPNDLPEYLAKGEIAKHS